MAGFFIRLVKPYFIELTLFVFILVLSRILIINIIDTVETIRILMLGDIVGRPGRVACQRCLKSWREKYSVQLVVANGENASGGNGLTSKNATELIESGIDVITTGNHIWKQQDYEEMFKTHPNVIRPANYHPELPGKGWTSAKTASGNVIGVINLQGQVFMEPIDNPFRTVDSLLKQIREITPIVVVDFHAEATSERVAMGYYLDGRVSAVLGTHTHVPSSDSRILSGGTAFRTDLGMVGPVDGVLGVDKEAILLRFLTGLPARFKVAKGLVVATGSVLTIDASTGHAISIENIEEIYDSELEETGNDSS